MTNFKQYRRTQIAEMADWVQGFDMDRVSISVADKEAGSPKEGDKIARNPANHADRWLVANDYFAANFEPLLEAQTGEVGLRDAAQAVLTELDIIRTSDRPYLTVHADTHSDLRRALSASAVAPTTGEAIIDVTVSKMEIVPETEMGQV